ncbi:MAG: hypothetical protein ISS31_09045 [Kiritimatiellae bacterium]|nr:hypothetical protein [Kiritimatiellia bacterium]
MTSISEPLKTLGRWRVLACLLPLVLSIHAGAVWADGVVDRAVFCVGTTVEDTNAVQWAYVLWQTGDDTLVAGRSFAVYAKDGDAAATNLYTRKAVTGIQTFAPTLSSLLSRAENLGDDRVALEERVDNLFLSVIPDSSLSLPEKLSAVIRGSMDDPDQFRNLVLLGRLHPSIDLCIGYAYAGRIALTGKTTFEIREFDMEAGHDIGVIGRVTVEAGAPTVLPAPGPPVQVPETSAKGNLNIKLRWAVPNPLRRLALLSNGFNVYRMTEAYAVANGYHLTPPPPATLVALAATVPDVKQINDLPALKRKHFTAADVSDFVADPTTYFLADDNDGYKSGGALFEDGDAFYYFATAVDVLLRDGLVSMGSLATACDRLWPDAPRDLQVVNDYTYDTATTTNKQVLRVSWEQHTNTNQDTVLDYYVYRWTNISHIQSSSLTPLVNRIAGPIPHLPGERRNEYVDDATGSPNVSNDQGRTFWYTVRSEDDSLCGGNLSPHSAPAFGVLRDREGPPAPTGTLYIRCCLPEVINRDPVAVSDPGPQDYSLAYYRMISHRATPGIAWAEFYAFDTAASNRIAKAHFQSGHNSVTVEWTSPRHLMYGDVPFYCRVGSIDGRVSEFAEAVTHDPTPEDFVTELVFDAFINCDRVQYLSADADRCGRHYAVPPGSVDGTSSGIEICVGLTPGTQEYRVYRRVDYGAMTLIAQGEADAQVLPEICFTNVAMPASPGTLCYYGQVLDEHGNASPLTLMGCIDITAPGPTPLLGPISPEGSTASKQMKIRWYCAPYGVERFQVWIARENGTLTNAVSPSLLFTGTVQDVAFDIDGTAHTNDFAVYHTPVLGPGFGTGPAYEVTADIEGGTYYVFIKPVDKGGYPAPDSRNSNAEDFSWTDTVLAGPMVPWPARELPPLTPSFNTNIVARRLPDSQYRGLAIRIGQAPIVWGTTAQRFDLAGDVDPLSAVFTSSNGDSLFPVVAYRYQEANSAFPVVSGDVIQVSPLMEQIASAVAIDPNVGTRLYDPFVSVFETGDDTGIGYIYLLDTQPVLTYGRYVYLLVRLLPNGEIAEVIPTPAVEVTP